VVQSLCRVLATYITEGQSGGSAVIVLGISCIHYCRVIQVVVQSLCRVLAIYFTERQSGGSAVIVLGISCIHN
jgi:hypothetical protein